jgi:hypothetical protein
LITSATKRSRLAVSFFAFLTAGAFLEAFFEAGFLLVGFVFLGVLATTPIYSLSSISEMELPARAAVYVQEMASPLDRAALGSKPLDLPFRFAVRAKAALPAPTTAVVFWGIHKKKSVDRATPRMYKPELAKASPYSPQIPAPTRKASTTCLTSGNDRKIPL